MGVAQRLTLLHGCTQVDNGQADDGLDMQISFCCAAKAENAPAGMFYNIDDTTTMVLAASDILLLHILAPQTSRTALMHPSFSGLFVTWAYLPQTTLPPGVTSPSSLTLTCSAQRRLIRRRCPSTMPLCTTAEGGACDLSSRGHVAGRLWTAQRHS